MARVRAALRRRRPVPVPVPHVSAVRVPTDRGRGTHVRPGGRWGLKCITAVDKLGAAGAAAVPEAAKDGFVQFLHRLSFGEARIGAGDRSFSVRYFRSRRG